MLFKFNGVLFIVNALLIPYFYSVVVIISRQGNTVSSALRQNLVRLTEDCQNKI